MQKALCFRFVNQGRHIERWVLEAFAHSAQRQYGLRGLQLVSAMMSAAETAWRAGRELPAESRHCFVRHVHRGKRCDFSSQYVVAGWIGRRELVYEDLISCQQNFWEGSLDCRSLPRTVDFALIDIRRPSETASGNETGMFNFRGKSIGAEI
ncbi:hypothetical protein DEM26_18585 [Thioclava sp. NG1]|uniref:hypothetical protein n=1 Tax=unclassified Thioclava TaxID=2621713 RepID=UPI000B54188C|nr:MULTISPECIES: hypothetical protein [unclassified Thioclava]OWY10305.1 hypothetical protein B6V72_17675 [Thioclava sp. F34-6]PWE48351.1 hypothetical protein DEM26_18585 [Thioclava sp. NG1]